MNANECQLSMNGNLKTYECINEDAAYEYLQSNKNKVINKLVLEQNQCSKSIFALTKMNHINTIESRFCGNECCQLDSKLHLMVNCLNNVCSILKKDKHFDNVIETLKVTYMTNTYMIIGLSVGGFFLVILFGIFLYYKMAHGEREENYKTVHSASSGLTVRFRNSRSVTSETDANLINL